MPEAQSSEPVAAAFTREGRFLDRLSAAADLTAAGAFGEAEAEILRALSVTPLDVRALKLLALVRFKLGRLVEARTVCRDIAVALPDDPGIRLKLGLIALKLDQIDESVRELELATRLAPGDLRAWSYLGFAYARLGETERAAAAFRRAGQEDRAAEAEQGHPLTQSAPFASPSPTPSPSSSLSPAGVSMDEASAPRTDPEHFFPPSHGGWAMNPASPLFAYAMARLAPSIAAVGAPEAAAGSTTRLAIGEEILVRADAVLACSGTSRWQVARRRVRGRLTEDGLDTDEVEHPPGRDGRDRMRFFRVTGEGEVLLAAPLGRLVSLRLQDDILYLREDCVLAFEGTLSWEYGDVPRGGVTMLQFRGQGWVAMRVEREPEAMQVTRDRPLAVSAPHLLGWVGPVVTIGTRAPAVGADDPDPGARTSAPALRLVCEGQGVVLIDPGAGLGAGFGAGFGAETKDSR